MLRPSTRDTTRTRAPVAPGDSREHLRRHFEVNAASIVGAALSKLARDGKFDAAKAKKAFAELGVDTEKIDPQRA